MRRLEKFIECILIFNVNVSFLGHLLAVVPQLKFNVCRANNHLDLIISNEVSLPFFIKSSAFLVKVRRIDAAEV